MNEKEGVKKVLPPYLPYKTLKNFLEGMKVAVPARIDRSLMGKMSGVYQALLLASLEYLNLIDSKGTPTEKLNALVHSEGANRQKLLKDILEKSYSFLFTDFDLSCATSSMLQQRFADIGTSGDTTRKCIAFFMAAAKDAGISTSPHFKKARGPRGSRAARSNGVKVKRKIQESETSVGASDEVIKAPSEEVSLEKLLLSKFPSFDPAWSAEVQTKWFEGFRELMAQFKKKEGENKK